MKVKVSSESQVRNFEAHKALHAALRSPTQPPTRPQAQPPR
jgi:hypothetical protein